MTAKDVIAKLRDIEGDTNELELNEINELQTWMEGYISALCNNNIIDEWIFDEVMVFIHDRTIDILKQNYTGI